MFACNLEFSKTTSLFLFSLLLLGFEIPQFRNTNFFTYGLGVIWRTQEGLESVRVIMSIVGAISCYVRHLNGGKLDYKAQEAT